jgi:hypothetical protein
MLLLVRGGFLMIPLEIHADARRGNLTCISTA